MTTECTQSEFEFQGVGRRKVVARFDAEHVSSDGGLALVREVDRRLGIVAAFSACFMDHRRRELIEHTVEDLISQRVFGIVAGYEDLPARPAKPSKAKQKQRPTGRKPLPEHLPVDEHTVRPDSCGACGSDELEAVDEVVETKLDVITEHLRRRVVRRKTCRCKVIDQRRSAAPAPGPPNATRAYATFPLIGEPCYTM